MGKSHKLAGGPEEIVYLTRSVFAPPFFWWGWGFELPLPPCCHFRPIPAGLAGSLSDHNRLEAAPLSKGDVR